jgi:hypothetical protein
MKNKDRMMMENFLNKDVHILVKIIFSPLIAYLFIGTCFLFVIFIIEQQIKTIGQKIKSHYFKNEFKVIEYHHKNFGFTFFFFLFFPFLLIGYVSLLIAAGIIYIYEYVVKTVEILYEEVIEQVQELWKNISNMFK